MLFWHTSVNAQLLANKGQLLKQNLKKFLDKNYPDSVERGETIPRLLNKEELSEAMEKYFRKRFPMMSKTVSMIIKEQNFVKIVQGFELFKYEDEDALVKKDEIINSLFERLCVRGDMKLRDYMDKNV